mgnify:CR=1 FL=1
MEAGAIVGIVLAVIVVVVFLGLWLYWKRPGLSKSDKTYFNTAADTASPWSASMDDTNQTSSGVMSASGHDVDMFDYSRNGGFSFADSADAGAGTFDSGRKIIL